MKAAKIIMRIVSWGCLIIGVVMLFASAVLEVLPQLEIPIVQNMDLGTAFIVAVLLAAGGRIGAMIVEDEAIWQSICEWVERK